MLNVLVKNECGKWEKIRPEGRGRPTRVFRLLLASASAEKTDLRGETPNCADADTPSSQEITSSKESEPRPEKEASAASASVQMMMTNQMEAKLRAMGPSQAAINKMKPEQAHTVLAGAVPKKAPGGCDEEPPTDEPKPSGGVMDL